MHDSPKLVMTTHALPSAYCCKGGAHPGRLCDCAHAQRVPDDVAARGCGQASDIEGLQVSPLHIEPSIQPRHHEHDFCRREQTALQGPAIVRTASLSLMSARPRVRQPPTGPLHLMGAGALYRTVQKHAVNMPRRRALGEEMPVTAIILSNNGRSLSPSHSSLARILCRSG